MRLPYSRQTVQRETAPEAATIRRVPMKKQFNRIADAITRAVGSPSALILAGLVIIVWAVTGPIFGFSDTWQLVINTGTTIVTFLMVFVIQNAQNRDSKAVHIKLDELIRAVEGARNQLVTAEHLSEEEQDEQIERLIEAAYVEGGTPEAARAAADVAKREADSAEQHAATAEKEASTAKSKAGVAKSVAKKAPAETATPRR
jgi:low affinity Fe/Cu permease